MLVALAARNLVLKSLYNCWQVRVEPSGRFVQALLFTNVLQFASLIFQRGESGSMTLVAFPCSDILIGQWSLSPGVSNTVQSRDDNKEGEHRDKSIDVSLWGVMRVGFPSLRIHS